MLKKNCPACQTPLAFSAVILAINPAKIPCRSCKHTIKIHTPHALAALVITIFVSISLLLFLSSYGAPNYLAWLALLVAGGLLEILYFYLIHKGTIKSNLGDSQNSQL